MRKNRHVDYFFTIFIIANRFLIFRAIMASGYALLLSNVTIKTCIHMCTQRTLNWQRHQIMFNINGVKICTVSKQRH